MPQFSPQKTFKGLGAILVVFACAAPIQAQQKQTVAVQPAIARKDAGIFRPTEGMQATSSRVGTAMIVNNSVLSNYFSIPGMQQEWIDNNILIDTDGTGAESVGVMKYTYCSSDSNPNGVYEVITVYDDSVYCAGPPSWPIADCAYGVSGLPGGNNGALACWIVTLDLAGVECNLTDGHGGSSGWGQAWDNDLTGPWLASGGLGQTDSFTWFDLNQPNANAFQGCFWFGGVPHAGFDMRMMVGQPGVQIAPGDGVSFFQLDQLYLGDVHMDTGIGQLEVDISVLQSATGMQTGFINFYTEHGWVIHNLPIAEQYTADTISVDFYLSDSSGVDITTMAAYGTFTDAPLNLLSGTPDNLYSLQNRGFNAMGRGHFGSGPPPPPPEPSPPPFHLPLPGLDFVYQSGHKNVQSAHLQCGPMSTANSMHWLSQRYPGIIPTLPDHIPGLGINGIWDGSLVSELEVCMGRTGRSRADGDLLLDEDFLAGKLKFIGLHNLELDVKHQDGFGGIGGGDYTAYGLRSVGHGNRVTWEFIIHEIEHGEDVEIAWTYPDGKGHWVTVTGAGQLMGVPFLTFQDDGLDNHADPNDSEGLTDGFTWLEDTNGDGHLEARGVKDMPKIDVAVSESPSASAGGPTFLPGPLFPSASSRLYVKNLEPGNPTYIGYSLAGAGPTMTPFGNAWLGQPYQALGPYIADANGEVDVLSPAIPPGTSGIMVWMQALEIIGPGAGEFSNPVVDVIQ